MANNLIPARAGELARAYVLGQREKISKSDDARHDRRRPPVRRPDARPDDVHRRAPSPAAMSTLPRRLRGYDLNFAGLGVRDGGAVRRGARRALLPRLLDQRPATACTRLVHRFAPASAQAEGRRPARLVLRGPAGAPQPVDLAVAWHRCRIISWTLEATMYYLVARGFGIHEPFHIFLLLTAAANLVIADRRLAGRRRPVRTRRLQDDRRLRRRATRAQAQRRTPSACTPSCCSRSSSSASTSCGR